MMVWSFSSEGEGFLAVEGRNSTGCEVSEMFAFHMTVKRSFSDVSISWVRVSFTSSLVPLLLESNTVASHYYSG